MAARPSLFRYGHDAVLRAGDGAPHEQKVPLRIHLDHAKTDFGVALGSHVARHPLAFDHSRGVGAWADRARLPMPGVAVGGRATAEMVAVHHPLESPSFGRAGHLHQLARRKNVYLDLGPGCRSIAVDGERPQDLRRRLEPRLLGVPQLGFGSALRAARAESELDAALPDLHHATGTRLDHGHGHRCAVFFEDPGHPELVADQSHAHCYSTLISTSTPAGRSSLVSA